MKHAKQVLVFCLVSFNALLCSAVNDMRFSNSITNAYRLRLESIIKRAHPDKQITLRSLHDIVKVGDAFVVSLSFALHGKGEAITEKKFLKIHPFFDPFLKEESDYYKKVGKVVTGVGYDGPIEEKWAHDYTNEELPTMAFTIYGKEKKWFRMKISYSDRKDDYTVVDFTIVAVE